MLLQNPFPPLNDASYDVNLNTRLSLDHLPYKGIKILEFLKDYFVSLTFQNCFLFHEGQVFSCVPYSVEDIIFYTLYIQLYHILQFLHRCSKRSISQETCLPISSIFNIIKFKIIL